jgi:hypothetical protein
MERKAKKLLAAAGIDASILSDALKRDEIYTFIYDHDIPDEIQGPML